MESAQKSVVVIGGGTGTHTILRGLKRHEGLLDLTAIVTMADSGGSTGRLRDEFGFLPIGDARMALVALAGEDELLMRSLFMHRFSGEGSLAGHSLGNLLLVALTDILGSEEAAITAAASVLRVTGKVIPVTTTAVDLVATYDDGLVVTGEHHIDMPPPDRFGHRIVDLGVTPGATISEAAAAAIARADLIILGPGDLYTSVLANCVVPGVREALVTAEAPVVYIANLMTRAGQTEGMGAALHTKEITRYLGRQPDVVVVNTAAIDPSLLERYAAEGEFPVACDLTAHGSLRVIATPLTATADVVLQSGDVVKRSLVRHDKDALADVILAILSETNPTAPLV